MLAGRSAVPLPDPDAPTSPPLALSPLIPLVFDLKGDTTPLVVRDRYRCGPLDRSIPFRPFFFVAGLMAQATMLRGIKRRVESNAKKQPGTSSADPSILATRNSVTAATPTARVRDVREHYGFDRPTGLIPITHGERPVLDLVPQARLLCGKHQADMPRRGRAASIGHTRSRDRGGCSS
jgi:hypothetical protein